jgi:hypothetical protein
MKRILLFAAAALLVTTAMIHAMGQPMVDGWVAGLGEQQRTAICLVWITDSIDWAVVAVLWTLAGWKQERGLLLAAAVAALIPLAMAVGILAIEPSFFGGWMLIGSVALALTGIVLSWRGPVAST